MSEREQTQLMPLFPLRDFVRLPGDDDPLWAKRPQEHLAVDWVLEDEARSCVFVHQKDPFELAPTVAAFHRRGTVSRVVTGNGADGLITTTYGLPGDVLRVFEWKSLYMAEVRLVPAEEPTPDDALLQAISENMRRYFMIHELPEHRTRAQIAASPWRLCGCLRRTSLSSLTNAEAQGLLETNAPEARLAQVNRFLEREIARINAAGLEIALRLVDGGHDAEAHRQTALELEDALQRDCVRRHLHERLGAIAPTKHHLASVVSALTLSPPGKRDNYRRTRMLLRALDIDRPLADEPGTRQ